jgi:hypothetical protein
MLFSVLLLTSFAEISSMTAESCVEYERLRDEYISTRGKISKVKLQLIDEKLSLSLSKGKNHEDSGYIPTLETSIDGTELRIERLNETLGNIGNEMKEMIQKCLAEIQRGIRATEKRILEINEIAKSPSHDFLWILKNLNESTERLNSLRYYQFLKQ